MLFVAVTSPEAIPFILITMSLIPTQLQVRLWFRPKSIISTFQHPLGQSGRLTDRHMTQLDPNYTYSGTFARLTKEKVFLSMGGCWERRERHTTALLPWRERLPRTEPLERSSQEIDACNIIRFLEPAVPEAIHFSYVSQFELDSLSLLTERCLICRSQQKFPVNCDQGRLHWSRVYFIKYVV